MVRTTWNVWPPAIFAVVIASFLAATGFEQWRLRELDHTVTDVAATTAPSIDHLESARDQLRNLQITARALAVSGSSDEVAPVQNARRSLDEAVKEYLALPVASGEREAWRDILAGKEAVDHATIRFEADVSHGDQEGALSTLRGEVATASADLDTAVTRAIEFNAAGSHELALEIHRLRTSRVSAAVGLNLLCTAIAICGATFLRHVIRRHEALMERHRALEEERASELEQFAGRVAHDILSPLMTVGFALQFALSDNESERTKFLVRGTAALARVKRIVSALLEFARAGAGPDSEAQADVADVLADLAAELEPTASSAGTTLTVTATTPSVVACDPGILTSLVANLARNAMKYIGDGPERRVEVRAFDRGDMVRVEVEDTGPGLPPDVEHRAFDAYARSRNSTQPGIGLGLATVKRLAEAHRGRVGVVSVPGKGCTFWFELPRATQDDVPAIHRAPPAVA